MPSFLSYPLWHSLKGLPREKGLVEFPRNILTTQEGPPERMRTKGPHDTRVGEIKEHQPRRTEMRSTFIQSSHSPLTSPCPPPAFSYGPPHLRPPPGPLPPLHAAIPALQFVLSSLRPLVLGGNLHCTGSVKDKALPGPLHSPSLPHCIATSFPLGQNVGTRGLSSFRIPLS